MTIFLFEFKFSITSKGLETFSLGCVSVKFLIIDYDLERWFAKKKCSNSFSVVVPGRTTGFT